MATGAQLEEEGVLPSRPPPPPPPPTSSNGNGNSNGNSQWRKYLDGLVSLCNDSSDRCPAGSLLDLPPPDLISRGSPCPNEPGAPTNGHRVAGAGTSNGPVLVLLDMNGTLLYRAKKPLRIPEGGDGGGGGGGGRGRGGGGGCGGGAGTVAFVHGNPVPLQYYMRPGARELVAEMVRHPRVRLAFYTSMRGVNALPAANFLMPEYFKSIGTAPEVYDRPFNARDTGGVNHWDTTRDLPLIWSTPGRVGAGFGPGNTVMVDDTPKKMRFMDAGLVVVPEYTQACVLAACGGGTGGVDGGGVAGGAGEGGAREAAAREQAEVMPRLKEYMCRLLEESGADVRPFIESNPFQPKASPDTKDENASTLLSDASSLPATHADGAPIASTGAGAHTGSKRNASSAREASAVPPSPAEALGAVAQALPSSGTALPDCRGGGGGANSLEEATATTPAVAAAVPAATTKTTKEAASITTAVAAAGTTRRGDARVSLLDAIELILTTGPLSGTRVGVGAEAQAGAKAGAMQDSGSPGASREARRIALGFQGFGDNVEVSVTAAVSELLKAASTAAERWDLPPGEQEALRAWLNAAATSVSRDN